MTDVIDPAVNPGWRFDLEPAARKAMSLPVRKIPKAFRDFAKPSEIDPRKWHKIENQSSMGSCFPSGTLVTMADGDLLPIEDVQFGHEVITHKGRPRQVVDTMSRSYTGEMVEVFAKGWGRLTMTADHVVLVRRDGAMCWVNAGDLAESDMMVVSPGVPEQPVDVLDLTEYLDGDVVVDGDEVSVRGSAKWFQRYLPLDDTTCWIIGYYCAEGSVDNAKNGRPHRVTFTSHQKEAEYHQVVREYAANIGAEFSRQEKAGSKAVNCRIMSPVLARFLSLVCGRGANLKEVPHFILSGRREQKLAFLRGYWAGDGSFAKLESGRVSAAGNAVACRQIHAATASLKLAQQVSTMAVSIGYKPGRTLTKKRQHQRFDSHQVYLYSKDACDLAGAEVEYQLASEEKKNATRTQSCEYGQLRKIREIKRYRVENLPVYDFTVAEDHSFVAGGLVVHNCQGHGLSSCLERLYWVATGGEIIQFSRIFAYLGTQKIDGLLGRDAGSTIAGGIELVSQHGLPTEDQVPYPNPVRYPNRSDINRILSTKNYDAGKPYKIRSRVAIRSYDDAIDWLAGGGAVSIGIAWPVQLDRNATVNSFGGGGRGGHAIAILGYLRNGNLVVANSHSERYGDSGWFYVTPSAFGQMLRHRYTACYGLSDMGQPKPRRVDFRKSKMFG